jgi:hypothetical protein
MSKSNDEEQKALIEKKPNLFQKLLDFLFGEIVFEDYEEDEVIDAEEPIEIEEIKLEEKDENENEMLEETDDMDDYTEEDIVKLQEDIESGKITSSSLTAAQTNLLFSLYMNQISELKESNEKKRQKLLEYRNSMNS